MARVTYRYRLPAGIPLGEVQDTLRLTGIAAAGLHGESRVRLEARHTLSPGRRECVVDGGTPVGDDFNRIFLEFLDRAFPGETIEVDRVPAASRRDDGPEPYRTFADWADELALDLEQVAMLRRVRRDLDDDTPLTASELDELIGLAAR